MRNGSGRGRKGVRGGGGGDGCGSSLKSEKNRGIFFSFSFRKQQVRDSLVKEERERKKETIIGFSGFLYMSCHQHTYRFLCSSVPIRPFSE